MSIVDDDPDIVHLFRDALKGMKGYSVFGFTDPIKALKHFKKNESKCALVLTDYRMPRMNGIELIKKIKDRKQLVLTIIMTAFDNNIELFHNYTENNTINGILQKPVRLEVLRKEINNYPFAVKVI